MTNADDEGKVACPVCGSPSLHTRGADEICPVCGWDDDPAQAADPAWNGGKNGISLNRARWSFTQFGQAFPPSEVGGS
jgi:RNA polymerase subunit RPABC4/transcription elongation factor Spt4